MLARGILGVDHRRDARLIEGDDEIAIVGADAQPVELRREIVAQPLDLELAGDRIADRVDDADLGPRR